MNRYSDELRRLAVALEEDFEGNALTVMKHLLIMLTSLLMDTCVHLDGGVIKRAFDKSLEQHKREIEAGIYPPACAPHPDSQVACSRECVVRVAQKSGKTGVMVPI